MFNTTTYELRTFDVEAVQVTGENIHEVAKWCGGNVQKREAASFSPTTPEHIEVEVQIARRPVRAKAFVGDWITCKGQHFRVYGEKVFANVFVPKST